MQQCACYSQKFRILLEKLEKKRKKIKEKKWGTARIGGLVASNLGWSPIFLDAIKTAMYVHHFRPIFRNQKLLQYKLSLVLAFVLIKLCSTVKVKFDLGKAYVASFSLR